MKRTSLPGAEVGVAEWYTGGQGKADGSDLRIVSADGTVVAHRVLMRGPGDHMRVAFALQPPQRTYYAYWGNAQADGVGQELEIRRGLLLEVWPYSGGGAANGEQARQTFQRAGKQPIIGRGFRERIYAGHNPFSGSSRICALYTGYFSVLQPGRYEFGGTARNAVFCLVDGEAVFTQPGWHGPTRRLQRSGGVELEKGLHKIEVYHISPWADPVVAVMWRPPGVERWEIMPAGVFTAVHQAAVGPMTQYARAVQVDVDLAEATECFFEGRYTQRRVFRANVVGRVGEQVPWVWDFGDGQTVRTTEATVSHVYLHPGVYRVSLRAEGLARPLERSHRIGVDRLWDRVTEEAMDRPADHAAIVREYDFTALDSPSHAAVLVLLREVRDLDTLRVAAGAFLRRENVAELDLHEAMPICHEATLRASTPAATQIRLEEALRIARNSLVISWLEQKRGRLFLQAGEDGKAVEALGRAIEAAGEDKASRLRREAQIALGDAYRSRGDMTSARLAYDSAGPGSDRARTKPAVVRGDYARQVEDYLRRGELDAAEEALDAWEQALPSDRLEGYSTLLKARLLRRRGLHDRLCREVEALVRVNPVSAYAPPLLMLSAQSHAKAGRAQQARAALEQIVREYPESPLAGEAAGILDTASGRAAGVE